MPDPSPSTAGTLALLHGNPPAAPPEPSLELSSMAVRELPPEILELIAERVVTISDFIRFRSVCRSWRQAAAPCKLRPQPPVLLRHYRPSIPDRYIFSIATGRSNHISLPLLVGKEICDTAYGWMLLSDIETRALSIHNPVTLAHIHLPSTDFLRDEFHRPLLLYDQFYGQFMVLFRSMMKDGRNTARFCKVGDESWSVLDNGKCIGRSIGYHKGKFFTMAPPLIYIIDVSVASSCQSWLEVSLMGIQESTGREDFLWVPNGFFVTADGELFLLFSEHLYKLDFDGQQIKWSKLRFEDYSIFFTFRQHPIMFCVKDFPGYKKNCAYFDACWYPDGVVGIIDFEDRTEEFMQCEQENPFDCDAMWIALAF